MSSGIIAVKNLFSRTKNEEFEFQLLVKSTQLKIKKVQRKLIKLRKLLMESKIKTKQKEITSSKNVLAWIKVRKESFWKNIEDINKI